MGCRHSSVDSSAPSILPPRFESQAHHLCFHQFKLICHVEKTKINKQRPGLAIFKKEIMTRWLGFKPRISGFKSIVGRHYGIMPPGFFLPPPRPSNIRYLQTPQTNVPLSIPLPLLLSLLPPLSHNSKASPSNAISVTRCLSKK